MSHCDCELTDFFVRNPKPKPFWYQEALVGLHSKTALWHQVIDNFPTDLGLLPNGSFVNEYLESRKDADQSRGILCCWTIIISDAVPVSSKFALVEKTVILKFTIGLPNLYLKIYSPVNAHLDLQHWWFIIIQSLLAMICNQEH